MRFERRRRAAEIDRDPAAIFALILVPPDVLEGQLRRSGVEGDVGGDVPERQLHEVDVLPRRPPFDGQRLVGTAHARRQLQRAARWQRSDVAAEIVERQVFRVRSDLHSLGLVREEGALHLDARSADLDGDSLRDDLVRVGKQRSRKLAPGELEHLARLCALLVGPVEDGEVRELEGSVPREVERHHRALRLHAAAGAQHHPGMLQPELVQELGELHVVELQVGRERQAGVGEGELEGPVDLAAAGRDLEAIDAHP